MAVALMCALPRTSRCRGERAPAPARSSHGGPFQVLFVDRRGRYDWERQRGHHSNAYRALRALSAGTSVEHSSTNRYWFTSMVDYHLSSGGASCP